MIDTNISFGRLMSAQADAWKLACRIGETMVASQSVIAERMTMMATGMSDPRRAPHAEMARLVPEKMAAFTRAGTAAAGQAGPVDQSLTAFDLFERSLAMSLAWWQPVHAQATANARRLNNRRR